MNEPRTSLWIIGPALVIVGAVVSAWYIVEWLVWYMRGAV